MQPEPIHSILEDRISELDKLYEQLEDDYKNTRKGSIYFNRKDLLDSKLYGICRRLKTLGKTYNIVLVEGIRYIPQGSVNIESKFTVFYTNINVKDALTMAKTDIKGYKTGAAIEIKPGVVTEI